MKSSTLPADFLPRAPRAIDPAATFDSLVGWMRQVIVQRKMPGAIMGISGTDSLLAFLICAKAFADLGKPDRVVGVHYGAPFPPPGKTSEEVEKIVSISPAYRWVPRTLVPWMKDMAPAAQIVVDDSFDYTDDYQRWANVMRRSLNGAIRTEALDTGDNYWVVGTRNATEQVLGSYSNVSNAVSLQPLLPLWKSEILKICQWLGAPDFAIAQSRQVDCDCGRYDVAAHNIEAVDMVLMAREGLLCDSYLEGNIEHGLLAKLKNFVEDHIGYAAFKRDIPYRPDHQALVFASE